MSLRDEGALVLAADTDSNPPADLTDGIAQLVAEYPAGGRRESLDAVLRLRRAPAPEAPPAAVAVVGTNGKTSTATYLARLLSAAGHRTGLYTSPHLSTWTERVRIDDSPCDPVDLLRALGHVHELARGDPEAAAELRFFDLLTLAAELVFARAGARVAVYEAGIGGRLDAVRALEPGLVLLTNVAIDHAEILGETRAEILTEKLLVAPAGAKVLSVRLAGELESLANRVAEAHGFQIVWVEDASTGVRGDVPELPAYLRSALRLAEAGAEAIDEDSRAGDRPVAVDLHLPGRFELGEHDAVPYVLDIAHNEAAWLELAAELRRRAADLGEGPAVALISVSPGKRRAGLVAALRSVPGLRTTILTRHTALPAADPEAVADELSAAGLEAHVVESVEAATELAFERAREVSGRVLVFGSTHLVGEVRPLLGGKAAG